MKSTTTDPMTTSTPPEARAALRRCLIDRIAVELFHADVLDGNTERGATWQATTEADREHYRACARATLRRTEPIVMAVALHKAKQAAFASLPPAVRMLVTDEGRKHFDAGIEQAIAAHDAHLLYGKPEQDERAFEQIHDIPTAREFTVINGGAGLRVESAQEAEGTVRS